MEVLGRCTGYGENSSNLHDGTKSDEEDLQFMRMRENRNDNYFICLKPSVLVISCHPSYQIIGESKLNLKHVLPGQLQDSLPVIQSASHH